MNREDILKKDFENIFNRDLPWENLKNKTLLVTGAYGMLASYLVFYLIYLNEYQGFHMTIICQGRNRDKMRRRFGIYLDKPYIVECYFSLNSEIDCDRPVDYIVHAASPANPSFYGTMPVEVSAPNVVGTYFLLEYARKCQVKGFLFFSSGDVYGTVNEQGKDITEDMMGSVDPLDPHSCYGEAKRMGECFCGSYAREYKIPTRIARIGHTYGPTMDIDSDPRVFASFVKNIVNHEDIVMLSDGLACRPFCYSADAVAAFFTMLFLGKDGEAYNMCNTEQFISVRELAEKLVGLYPEKNLKVVCRQREENKNYLEASFNKANKPIEDKLKALGWKCEFTVEEGFRRVIEALQ